MKNISDKPDTVVGFLFGVSPDVSRQDRLL